MSDDSKVAYVRADGSNIHMPEIEVFAQQVFDAFREADLKIENSLAVLVLLSNAIVKGLLTHCHTPEDREGMMHVMNNYFYQVRTNAEVIAESFNQPQTEQ